MQRSATRCAGLIGLAVLAICRTGAANERPAGSAAPPAPATDPATPSHPVAAEPAAEQRSEPSVQPRPEPSVEAAPPVTADTRVLVDAMLGIGSENLNVGIGARGGKTFANHLYVGGLFVYHVGTSASATVGGEMITSSVSGFYLGPEVGYDFSLAPHLPIVLRPYLGIGMSDASAKSSIGVSASSSELSMWPGVAAHYSPAGSSYLVGADLRFVTGPWGTSIGLFVLGGMHFGS